MQYLYKLVVQAEQKTKLLKNNIMKTFITVAALLFLTSCVSLSTHSLENTMQKTEIPNDVEQAYQFAYRTAMELNWVMTHSDSHMHAFTASTPQIMKRWEDTVNVFIEKSENGSVIVVKSKLGHKPNAEYIGLYLRSIKDKAMISK